MLSLAHSPGGGRNFHQKVLWTSKKIWELIFIDSFKSAFFCIFMMNPPDVNKRVWMWRNHVFVLFNKIIGMTFDKYRVYLTKDVFWKICNTKPSSTYLPWYALHILPKLLKLIEYVVQANKIERCKEITEKLGS